MGFLPLYSNESSDKDESLYLCGDTCIEECASPYIFTKTYSISTYIEINAVDFPKDCADKVKHEPRISSQIECFHRQFMEKDKVSILSKSVSLNGIAQV